MLRGNIRIRGFQRDVFSFANLMAMSAVLGLALASVSREIWQRVLGFAWAAGFAVMLVLSGGRSALFGIFASALLSIAYIANNSLTRRWAKVYVLVWVGITVIISFAGVGQLTDQVSGMFLGKSRVGDSTSAYMRDDNWTNMMEAFEEEPIILITGGPFGSLLDSKIAPMFHWADNQFLWDTYHLGIAGALAIGLYFFRVLWIGRKSPRPEASDVLDPLPALCHWRGDRPRIPDLYGLPAAFPRLRLRERRHGRDSSRSLRLLREIPPAAPPAHPDLPTPGATGMKVLLRIRGDVREYPGGDYVQLLRTRETLERLGFECAVSPGLAPMPPGIDFVHLFNTTRIHETCLQFREAKRRGIPVVLTPIWHSMREMARFYSTLYKVPLFPVWKYMAAKELFYARRSRQPVFAAPRCAIAPCSGK